MATFQEALLVTTETGTPWSSCVYDLHTGSTLATYKGNFRAVPNTLCTVRGEYLFHATMGRPMLHVWTLQKKEQVFMKMVVTGKLSAVAISPDGHYCVGAVDETIHVWQVCSGLLLAVITKHYQKITCIMFTDDGSHFVSAGDDNLVQVWSMYRLIGSSGFRRSNTVQSDEVAPTHTWNQHTLPVKGLHVGHGGIMARVATASLDRTCKLYELHSGNLLLNLSFDHSLSVVTMDSMELFLYVASASGQMYSIKLFSEPVVTDRHVSLETETDFTASWKAHESCIQCIAVNSDGSMLVTGGQDGHLKVWESQSGQCCRDVNLKGPVNNLAVMSTPLGLTDMDSSITWPIKTFDRTLYNCDTHPDSCVEIILTDSQKSPLDILLLERLTNQRTKQEELETAKDNYQLDSTSASTNSATNSHHAAERHLYDAAIRNILNDS